MKTKLLPVGMVYDGTQLRSLWAYLNHNLLGPSIISWIGPCQVSPTHMVDGEDLNEGATIEGSKMLHFIIEIFDRDLAFAVALQRLFVSLLKDDLNFHSIRRSKKYNRHPLRQSGDDLFWGSKKLSISIATSSPVSQMIHLALNVSNQGTPVPTSSLEDFGVNPRDLAKRIMKVWAIEFDSIMRATQKVRPVL